jgi:ABC-type phosphate transport system substrate-binding protein
MVMSRLSASISVAAFTLTMVVTAASAQTTLKVDGSTGAMPLIAALAKAYEAKTPGIRIEIGKGLGTKSRIEA